METRLWWTALVALVAGAAVAPAQVRATTPAPKPISDNSFLVEEAYNQEEGVVQHIGNYRRSGDGWAFTFTQEWPAPSQRHQLSYTIPLLGGSGSGSGAGDVAINYRYQAIGKDEEPVWFAPRFTLLLPTGDVASQRGAGGPGVQVSLPVSVQVNDALVTHWNAGATTTRARATNGVRATSRSYNAAASVIWLLAPTLNLMLESTWDRTGSLDDAGTPSSTDHLILLPGVRGAINLASGMQIVPGIGMPIGLQQGGVRELFLYFSVEHSFR